VSRNGANAAAATTAATARVAAADRIIVRDDRACVRPSTRCHRRRRRQVCSTRPLPLPPHGARAPGSRGARGQVELALLPRTRFFLRRLGSLGCAEIPEIFTTRRHGSLGSRAEMPGDPAPVISMHGYPPPRSIKQRTGRTYTRARSREIPLARISAMCANCLA